MSTLDDLIRETDELKAKLSDNQRKIRAAEQAKRDEELEDLKPLAILAHELLCRMNHTDGCSWGYECRDGIHHWTGEYSAHDRWLAAVEKLTKPPHGMAADEIRRLLEGFAKLRVDFPHALMVIDTLRQNA